MIKRKSGFTLMEIMVVIIVIAVLASVAGPMIGSITDQGRASATKSKLSSLKSALLAYQSDIGRLPTSNISCTQYYCQVQYLSWDNEDGNVLYSDNCTLNGSVPNYSRKWKGPYMDSDPTDFMYDSWGQPIQYVAYNKNVYLWSYGANQSADNTNLDHIFKLQTCGTADESLDDIVVSVHRFKRTVGIPTLNTGS